VFTGVSAFAYRAIATTAAPKKQLPGDAAQITTNALTDTPTGLRCYIMQVCDVICNIVAQQGKATIE
jgi:hypothetical protein